MIFAMVVFSVVCAGMIWVGLRAPKKSDHKHMRGQAAR